MFFGRIMILSVGSPLMVALLSPATLAGPPGLGMVHALARTKQTEHSNQTTSEESQPKTLPSPQYRTESDHWLVALLLQPSTPWLGAESFRASAPTVSKKSPYRNHLPKRTLVPPVQDRGSDHQSSLSVSLPPVWCRIAVKVCTPEVHYLL